MTLPADYNARSASEKLDLLWAEITADPYTDAELPRRVPTGWERRKLFSVGHNRESFEHISDEMPADRTKLVHRYGTTATVRIEVDNDHGYTGFFAAGGPAVLRFSDAAGGGKTPSLALKFMVDGAPSLNYLALPFVRRDPADRNPLTGVYANATPPPTDLGTKAVAWSFQRTAEALGGKRLYAVYLPLHHLAGLTPDGQTVAEPKVPDRLEFHGTAEARKALTEHNDWRRSLSSLPSGTRMFDLKLAAAIDAEPVAYGSVTLEQRFVASPYGDERLFFQHDTGPT